MDQFRSGFLAQQQIIQNFDGRIFEVASFVESALEMFNHLRKVWSQTTDDLRETLAQEKSLRKRDFDQIIQGVFEFQEKQEKSVRSLICQYVENQKALSQKLKEILLQVGQGKIGGDVSIFKECIESVVKLRIEFEEKEGCCKRALEIFKRQQKQIAETLDSLRQRKGDVFPKEFKAVVGALLESLAQEEISARDDDRDLPLLQLIKKGEI